MASWIELEFKARTNTVACLIWGSRRSHIIWSLPVILINFALFVSAQSASNECPQIEDLAKNEAKQYITLRDTHTHKSIKRWYFLINDHVRILFDHSSVFNNLSLLLPHTLIIRVVYEYLCVCILLVLRFELSMSKFITLFYDAFYVCCLTIC